MAGEEPATAWFYVSLPWATFGVAVRGGVVVDAAPIAAWTVGKDEEAVAAWFRRRGARFVRLGSSRSSQRP